MASPAPARSVTAKANSITTRVRRKPCRPELAAERPPSFNASLKFQRDVCQAGAQPHRTPARTVAPKVKNSTGRLKRMSASGGTEKGGRRTTMTFNITHARLIPRRRRWRPGLGFPPGTERRAASALRREKRGRLLLSDGRCHAPAARRLDRAGCFRWDGKNEARRHKLRDSADRWSCE